MRFGIVPSCEKWILWFSFRRTSDRRCLGPMRGVFWVLCRDWGGLLQEEQGVVRWDGAWVSFPEHAKIWVPDPVCLQFDWRSLENFKVAPCRPPAMHSQSLPFSSKDVDIKRGEGYPRQIQVSLWPARWRSSAYGPWSRQDDREFQLNELDRRRGVVPGNE